MSLETQLLMKQLMAQYFLLLNGKRAMKGDFDCSAHEIDLYRWLSFHYADLALVAYDANRMAVMNRAGSQFKDLMALNFTVALGFRPFTPDYPIHFNSMNAVSETVEVACILVGATQALEISRAGDINFLDDKFVQLSHDSVGIPANEGNRGKLRFVKGVGGARDRVYQCMKSDSDVYSWVEIANGGA